MLQFTLLDVPSSLSSKIKGEPLKRELERRSHDSFRIYNPTAEDYPIIWDGRYAHVVPSSEKDVGFGRGQLVVERHIATKFVNEMTSKIVNKDIEFEISRINGVRKKKGMPVMNKYQGGEEEQESMRLMQEWDKKIPDLWKQLCLGKVSDYGIYNELGRKFDEKATHEVVIEEMENNIVEKKTDGPEINEVDNKKENLIKEVSE